MGYKAFIPENLIVKNQEGRAVFVKYCAYSRDFKGDFLLEMYYAANFAVSAKADQATIDGMTKRKEGDPLTLYYEAFPEKEGAA